MARWRGQLHLGDGWLCYLGPLGPTDAHAHLATQIMVADTPFELTDGAGRCVRTRRAVIGPNQQHALQGTGQDAALLYLPQQRPDESSSAAVDWAREAASDLELPAGDPAQWARTTAEAVAHHGIDASGYVAAAMEQARRELPAAIVLERIAREVGIGSSALGHRFKATIGVPWRQWLLAERLQVAAQHVARGSNLTDAAHAAGFSDSAHLSRTFRRMFGIAPSDVTAVSTWHVY